jgi:valyl-tRNA synthetase
METGYDILFFWVARMMMLGLFLTDVEPFHTVYLHGLVRAEGGVKMSKTKDNVTDPVELIDEIGADAVRLALTTGTSPGLDQRLTMAKLERSRNFANKLWNAARFFLARNPGDGSAGGATPGAVDAATIPERWIRSRLAATVADATRRLDRLDLGGYAAVVSDFAWSELCDWYLEVAKVELRAAERPEDARRAWRTGVEVLSDTLRLLHPVMPFVTEEIWSVLPATSSRPEGPSLLMTAAWPDAGERDFEAEAAFEALAEVVRTARNLRTEAGIPAGSTVTLHVEPGSAGAADAVEAGRRWIEPLARVRCQVDRSGRGGPTTAVGAATALGAVWLDDVPAGEGVPGRDDAAEALRRNRDRLRALLADPGFTTKAPATVVERERARLAGVEDRLRQVDGAPEDPG